MLIWSEIIWMWGWNVKENQVFETWNMFIGMCNIILQEMHVLFIFLITQRCRFRNAWKSRTAGKTARCACGAGLFTLPGNGKCSFSEYFKFYVCLKMHFSQLFVIGVLRCTNWDIWQFVLIINYSINKSIHKFVYKLSVPEGETAHCAWLAMYTCESGLAAAAGDGAHEALRLF